MGAIGFFLVGVGPAMGPAVGETEVKCRRFRSGSPVLPMTLISKFSNKTGRKNPSPVQYLTYIKKAQKKSL